MCKQMQGSRVKPVRMGVLALTIVLIALTVPASGQQECPPAGEEADGKYDHQKDGYKVLKAVVVDPGELIIVEIQNTCKAAFTYAHQAFERLDRTRFVKGQPCPLETVHVCITHKAGNGAYVVSITKKDAPDPKVTTTLEPAQLVIPVRARAWSLGFSSGPTVSKLTDPVFAVDTETVDGEEKSVLVRDRAAEDDVNLGLAAFGTASHAKLPPLGLAVGLGLDERNEASYYLGIGWQMGDKALLTVGHAWGSTKRLPSGLAVGDVVDDANVLNDLPSRTEGDWFFSVSFGLAGGKDKFLNKLKPAGKDNSEIGN